MTLAAVAGTPFFTGDVISIAPPDPLTNPINFGDQALIIYESFQRTTFNSQLMYFCKVHFDPIISCLF